MGQPKSASAKVRFGERAPLTMSVASIFRILRHDPVLLEQERKRLRDLVRRATPIGSVVEVGSTAVGGLVGKEDIDFAVLVPRDQFCIARDSLDRAFRRDPGQLSNEEYQGYKLDSPLDAAIQLLVEGGRFDTFKDFLRSLRKDALLRVAYNDLKRRWDGRPMDEYRAAKREFIETVLTRDRKH